MGRWTQKGFSRYERNGIIVLCTLIILTIAVQRFIYYHYKNIPRRLTEADERRIAEIEKTIRNAPSFDSRPFDGNNNYDEKISKSANEFHQAGKYDNLKIEVNSASAADFEKLYGIGKVLSSRIVSFRDKLGGFYSISQLKDVYGIQDSVFQKIKKNLAIRPAKIKKININMASYEELTANPYFFSTIAKQVIGYRSKVRPFESVEDIKNLYFVRDHPETYDKIAVYISIN